MPSPNLVSKVKEVFGGLTSLERYSLILITIGVIIRLYFLFTGEIAHDGAYYAYTAGGLSETHSFQAVWPQNEASEVRLNDGFTFTFSLTFPAYLFLFYEAFGATLSVMRLASVTAALITLGIVYWTTKDLFDRKTALMVTAILSLDFILITSARRNLSENFFIIFLAATLWSLIKSYKDSHYMLYFGIFSSLLYLTKTDIRYWIIIGGSIALLAWRYFLLGKKAFTDVYVYIGLSILIIVAILRTIAIAAFPNYVSIDFIDTNALESSNLVQVLLLKLPFIILCVFIVGMFFLPHFFTAIRKYKNPFHNTLLLVIIGFTILVWVETSLRSAPDPSTNLSANLFSKDNLRYTNAAALPILWIIFKESKFTDSNLPMLTIFKASIFGILKRIKTPMATLHSMISDKTHRIHLILSCLSMVAVIFSLLYFGFLLMIFYFFAAIALLFRSQSKRYFLLTVVLLIVGLNSVSSSFEDSYMSASEELNNRICSGDVIVFEPNPGSVQPFGLYPYIENHDITVIRNASVGTPTYILSPSGAARENYTLIGFYESKVERTFLQTTLGGILGGSTEVSSHPSWLWERNGTIHC